MRFSAFGRKYNNFDSRRRCNHIDRCVMCIRTRNLRCDWTGRQIDLPLHMNTTHNESLGANFEFFQKSSVTFNPTESWHSINIVNGYGKHFVYYMYSDSAKKLIYFTIYLLGTKADARNYLIDFEIMSKSSTFQKVDSP